MLSTVKKGAIALACFGAVLIQQTSVNASVACSQLTTQQVYCPDCPGFSFCLCMETYGGWVCPSADIVCTARYALTDGNSVLACVPSSCYTSRSCTAPPEGCYPVSRPCRKGDEIGQNGSWCTWVVVGFGCP